MELTEFLLARIAEDEGRLVHEFDCDRLNTYDYGSRWGDCDCDATARVLAECEAKRRIVTEHPSHVERRQAPSALSRLQARASPSVIFCETCGDPYAWDQTPPVEWPCPTLRLLALPYSDHPDFQEEWRP